MAREREQQDLFEELHRVSLRKEQLLDRQNVLKLLIDFKRTNGQSDQQYSKESVELKEIEDELRVLTEKTTRLQPLPRTVDTNLPPDVGPAGCPPSFTAPQVFLDVQDLPRHACHTQCPFCRQYVTTEISMRPGSAAFLICLVSSVFCCVAGCCLLPFCIDSCKDVIHRCPKCRSQIHKCKKF